jgi:hypothetical protein
MAVRPILQFASCVAHACGHDASIDASLISEVANEKWGSPFEQKDIEMDACETAKTSRRPWAIDPAHQPSAKTEVNEKTLTQYFALLYEIEREVRTCTLMNGDGSAKRGNDRSRRRCMPG